MSNLPCDFYDPADRDHDQACLDSDEDECICERIADERVMKQVAEMYGDLWPLMAPIVAEHDPLFRKYRSEA